MPKRLCANRSDQRPVQAAHDLTPQRDEIVPGLGAHHPSESLHGPRRRSCCLCCSTAQTHRHVLGLGWRGTAAGTRRWQIDEDDAVLWAAGDLAEAMAASDPRGLARADAALWQHRCRALSTTGIHAMLARGEVGSWHGAERRAPGPRTRARPCARRAGSSTCGPAAASHRPGRELTQPAVRPSAGQLPLEGFCSLSPAGAKQADGVCSYS